MALAASPYITRVFDFVPAPGQFINSLPAWSEGTTYEQMVEKVSTNFVGKGNGDLISLGGYGGYVTFGFDHKIVNVEGERDFLVYGNAFEGSSEPGIILVSQDKNGDGLPNDDWYEIWGSAHSDAETIFDYEITYYRPEVEPASSEDEAWNKYVRWRALWTDAEGAEHDSIGYIPKNSYHMQSWYPGWISEDEITFRGTKLPLNGEDQTASHGGIQSWYQYAFDYGYADNQPNASEAAKIDIAWARDADGNEANLAYIDFIRVYNGENQVCGWLGETSTEVSGCEDLHPDAVLAISREEALGYYFGNSSEGSGLIAHVPAASTLSVYDLLGARVIYAALDQGLTNLAQPLPAGLYVVSFDSAAGKLVFKTEIK